MTAILSRRVCRLEIRSFWLHARGEGGGADFDLVMERDTDTLPVLRGKHVAGLLRLALERAAAWGWVKAHVPDLLMGARGDGAPGCLDIRSARVPSPLRQALCQRAAVKAACFRRLATTAIDGVQGVAKEQHLRAIEAAIPLPLEFAVSFAPEDRRIWAARDGHLLEALAEAEQHWGAWLDAAWPAFDEVGAKRTRGFGRLALGHAGDRS